MMTNKDPDKRTVKLGTGNTTSYTEEICAPIAKKSSLSLFEGDDELISKGPPREVTEGEQVMALKAIKAIRERNALRDALVAKQNAAPASSQRLLRQVDVADLLHQMRGVSKGNGKKRVCEAVKHSQLRANENGLIQEGDALVWVKGQAGPRGSYNPLDID